VPSLQSPVWVGDLEHLNAVDDAVLATDDAGRIIFANTAARRLHRRSGEDLSGLRLVEALFQEEDHEAVAGIQQRALAGQPWGGRLSVLRVDDSAHDAEVSCWPLRRDGAVVGLFCLVEDTSGSRGRASVARRLADRLARLARVAADLGRAEDVETVTKVVVSQAADAVGSTVASLSLLADEETLELVGLRGAREGMAERWATYSIHDATPASDVARTGEMLLLSGCEAIKARYPVLEGAVAGQRSILGLPLRVLGRTIGVITLSFPGRLAVDAAELEFYGILADSCAQALERIRARQEASEHEARMRFLADAATELATSLDYELTLANVARLVVPTVADWCAIDVVEDGRLHRVAVEHIDPSKVALAVEMQERYPPDPASPGGAWEVMRTGKSILVPEVAEEMLVAAARDEEHLRMARELALRSFMVVPLIAHERVLGVLTWVTAESGRRYTSSDVAFAEDLGRRAAVAIDNAQLHSQTREAAVRLQRAVLPDLASVDLSGYEVANQYSPAGRTEVGGDFYDAVGLPDGRLAIVVGDVMGRGVAAAAGMAQMRSAVRAYLAVEPTPEVVLRLLDQLFDTYSFSQLVTMVLVLIDPEHDELVVVNAGHPPPVILRADGGVEQLPYAHGAPLGAPTGRRHAVTVPFHAGDTILAFTDGLIERREEDIDQGQSRLLDSVPLLAGGGLSEALAEVVERTRCPARDDDVAALAVRRLSA